jgi:hypothetical protein
MESTLTEPRFSLVSILTAFAITTFVLYLLGYWSSFDINILEYASFQDILKLAIYPVLIGAFSSLAYFFIQIFINIEEIKKEQLEKVFILIPSKYAQLIALLAVIATLPVSIFIADDALKWTIIGILVFVALNFTIVDLKILQPHVTNLVARKIVILLGLFFLTNSFGWGKRNASLILQGQQAKIISTKIFRDEGDQSFRQDLLKNHDTLKYLGAAGEYFFFVSMDNSTTFVIKYSDLHFLEFSKLAK